MLTKAAGQTTTLTMTGKAAITGTGLTWMSAAWNWLGENHYEIAATGVIIGVAINIIALIIQIKRGRK